MITNIKNKAGINAKTPGTGDIEIDRQSLSPNEYVNVLKYHPGIIGILSKYDSRMIKQSLDMIAENYAYENQRLNNELNEIKSGKRQFSSAQRGAYSFNSQVIDGLRAKLRSVESAIKENERNLAKLSPSTRDTVRTSLYEELVFLRREKTDLDTKISLADGQSRFGHASEIGVVGSFKSQEYSVQNEYEANIRETINDARRTVLSVVDARRVQLETELENAKEELSAMQLILDAYSQGKLTLDHKLSILESSEAKRSRDINNAAAVLWADQ